MDTIFLSENEYFVLNNKAIANILDGHKRLREYRYVSGTFSVNAF